MLKDTPEIKAERVTETLTVYQQKGVFSFGTDAMLLADYVSEQTAAASAKKLCDLCSGAVYACRQRQALRPPDDQSCPA